MVFIYHRIYRPHFTDFEAIPKAFRQIYFKINNYFSPLKKKINNGQEPNFPKMHTNFPGPKMKNLLNDLELISPEAINIKTFINHQKSQGNFLVDCDENTYLDLSNITNKNILGYNNNKFYKKFQNLINSYQINSVNKIGNFQEYLTQENIKLLEDVMQEILPKAMDKIIFNENPEELVYIISMLRKGNFSSKNLINEKLNLEYLEENKYNSNKNNNNTYCNNYPLILNEINLTENYKILKILPEKFINAKKNEKLNITNMNFMENKIFEYATFPYLKYPLKENMLENYHNENKSLEEIEKILKKNFDVSAIVIEAINQGETWATPTYFYKLRNLATLYNVDFIVDERKSGLSVGRIWQNELWNLPIQPDFIIFGNKLLNNGFIARKDAIDENIMNTICGFSDINLNLNNLLSLKSILEIIKEEKYFEKGEKAGEYFKKNLKDLNKNLNLFNNIRGKAQLIAFDIECDSGNKNYNKNESRNLEKDKIIFNRFLSFARNSGIFLDGNELTNTVYVRPNVTIENKHYDHFLNVLEDFKKNK
jgi:4-aminobutyrate aminotransferase-like enzyme